MGLARLTLIFASANRINRSYTRRVNTVEVLGTECLSTSAGIDPALAELRNLCTLWVVAQFGVHRDN